MPEPLPDTHPELHAILAVWYQDMARYHMRKAIDPLDKIPIPEKPTTFTAEPK